MELLFESFLIVISSIFLVKYCAAFLILKYENRVLSLVSFGIIYFLFQYNIVRLLSSIFTEPTLSLIKVIIMGVIILGLSFIFFKVNLGKQIFLVCSFFAVQAICAFIATSLNWIVRGMGELLYNTLWVDDATKTVEQVTSFYRGLSVVYMIISVTIFTFSCGMVLRSITRSFIYNNYTLRTSEVLSLILPCLTGLSLALVLKTIIYKPDGTGLQIYSEVPIVNILIPMSAILILFTIGVSIKLFQKNIQLHVEERNAAVFQHQTQQIQEQIRNMSGIYNEIRGIRHDMKSHIANIHLLVAGAIEGSESDKIELEKYLGKFENTLSKFEFIHQTGNAISDVIVHQKYIEAIDKKIDFLSDFLYPNHLNLDGYDLAVILNNALENAIEACNSVQQPNRFIRLHSYKKGEMFFIKIENSFVGYVRINEYTNLPESSKSDESSHGMGLSNIQCCARRYFGDIDIQVSKAPDNNVFCLTIMLQGRV